MTSSIATSQDTLKGKIRPAAIFNLSWDEDVCCKIKVKPLL